MVFTEVKKRNRNIYYYRILAFRNNGKVSKKRIYLGSNLLKNELKKSESCADRNLYLLRREMRGEFGIVKEKLVKYLKENGVKKAGVFGSFARGDQKKSSDIDIIIQPSRKISGFKFMEFKEELSKEIGRKVDVVTYRGISPILKERILNQEVRII